MKGGRRLKRLFALLLCMMLLCLSASSPAESPEDPEDVFIPPTLPPGAIEWDERHPELLDPEMLYARSAILIEAESGDVLFEKNADEVMYPASTTKMLTAYIALQMADLENDVVTVSSEALASVPRGYQTIPISVGEEINILDLISATLVRSGNEGAYALAEHISGSESAFAALMNSTAAMLGCSGSTHFTNAAGLHDPNHYTTARDLSVIARTAMHNETFRSIVRSNTYNMPATGPDNRTGHPARTLVGGTLILDPESDYYFPDCIGIKTGMTNKAGYCFIGAAKRGGIELISVVLYSSRSGRWTDTAKLFRYGFTQIESITPEALYAEDPRVIEVAGFDLNDSNHGELVLGIRAQDESKDMTIVGRRDNISFLRDNFSQVSSVSWTREFRAPINVGDVMGVLTFYSANRGSAQYDLVATRSIAARENAPPTLEQIEAYTAADENPFPRFTWDLLVPPAGILLLALLVICGIIRHRRKHPRMKDVHIMKPPRYLT